MAPPRPGDRGRLTERDGEAIARQVPGVVAVAPQIRTSVQLVTGGRSASTQAVGSTEAFGSISNLGTSDGRFITKSDVGSAARVVVIGLAVLFTTHDPNQALRCADRALLMREGRVLAEGAVRDVIEAEALRMLYSAGVLQLWDAAGGPPVFLPDFGGPGG